ncbi:MAG: helix-turn-helix domain-containing protein, partial [Candidatus Tectomicrobia bacterium]|nr:helix-turn-helix domain-containing protein [Candidatus Tectomicrobia bacterium]
MAKKFSLKDNPIFQRLEAVKPKETEPSVGESPPSEETPPSQDFREPSFEGLNVTLTDRASKYDPQSLTPIEQKETTAQTLSESVTSQDLRGSIFEEQNMTLTDRASKHDPQNLISTEQRETLGQAVTEPNVSQDIEELLHEDQSVTLTIRPSTFDPQQMLPKNSGETSARGIAEPAVLQDLEEPPYEGQNMTLINRASRFDPQQSFPRPQEKMSAQDLMELLAPSLPSPSTSPAPDLGLQEHLDGALFPSLFNEIIDELLPTLDLAEQALYIRFFRLSYGFHRNYCTVSQPLLMERTGLSRNTIRTTLQSLSRKGWIRTIETGNRISTTYRVVLPRERV